MNQLSCSLRGRVKTSVLQGGVVVQENPWQRNLILDRFLNQMATVPICDLFRYCAIGTGDPVEVAHEDLTGTYTLSGTTLTRDSGARNFSADDVGKLARFSSGEERYITGYTSATVVTVGATGSESGDTDVKLFKVGIINLLGEDSRTGDLSVASGENGTTDAGAVRTFKRTFVFPANVTEPTEITGTFTRTGSTIEVVGSGTTFHSGYVGAKLTYSDGTEYTITAVVDGDTLTVTPSTGTTVSVGAHVSFFRDYTELGMSEIEDAFYEVNTYIAFDNIPRVYYETPTTPAQQLKVQYELELTFSPSTTQPTPSTYDSFPITDPGNLMSANKTGQWVLENILTSTVDPDGETNLAQAILDPSAAGFFGIAQNTTALDPLDGDVRTTNLFTKEFEAQDYTDGDFLKDYVVTLSANEAVSTLWRSIMLCDPTTGLPAFTFLFRYPQTKDSSHSLRFTLRKSWGRDLSAY